MWKKIKYKKLREITACESLADLRHQLDDEAYRKIIALARIGKINDGNAKSLALISAIESSSVPIDIFWIVTGCVEVGVLSVAALPVTIAVLAASGIAGAGFFYDTYKNKKQQKNKLFEYFQLMDLKLQALDELIHCEKNKILSFKNKFFPEQALQKHKPAQLMVNDRFFAPTKRLPIKRSVGVGFASSVVLGITFGMGVSSLFEYLGYLSLATALTGPVGLGIAIAVGVVSIGMGVYLGCQHYQARKAQHLIQCRKKFLETQLQKKQQAYRAVVHKRKQVKLASQIIHFAKREYKKEDIRLSMHAASLLSPRPINRYGLFRSEPLVVNGEERRLSF